MVFIKKDCQNLTTFKLEIINEDILDKADDLVKSKPDCLLVPYVETNNITNHGNLLNFVQKIL